MYSVLGHVDREIVYYKELNYFSFTPLILLNHYYGAYYHAGLFSARLDLYFSSLLVRPVT